MRLQLHPIATHHQRTRTTGDLISLVQSSIIDQRSVLASAVSAHINWTFCVSLLGHFALNYSTSALLSAVSSVHPPLHGKGSSLSLSLYLVTIVQLLAWSSIACRVIRRCLPDLHLNLSARAASSVRRSVVLSRPSAASVLAMETTTIPQLAGCSVSSQAINISRKAGKAFSYTASGVH